MEEVRSTEVLDREILEDARKKAEKILKAADHEADVVRDEWNGKIDELSGTLAARYEAKLAAFRKKLDDALPLEKKRARIKFIGAKLNEAMDHYFASLPGERVEALIVSALKPVAGTFSGLAVRVEYRGMDETAAGRTVRAALPGIRKVTCVPAPETARYTGCIVMNEADGVRPAGTVSYRATLEEIRDHLLDRKRAELVAAIFQGELA